VSEIIGLSSFFNEKRTETNNRRDGQRVASASWDNSVRFWDEDHGRRSSVFRRLDGIATAVAFSPDGRRLGTVEREGLLSLWEPPSMQPVWSVPFQMAPNNQVDGRVAFHPDGTVLALSGNKDCTVRLYDTRNGEPRGDLQGHDRPTTDVVFNPDGARVATDDESGTLRIWDLSSRSAQTVIKAHDGCIYRLAFHPDGTIVASASMDQSVRIWDTVSGRLLAALKHAGQVYGVAFSPDGSRLAAACGDNTIRLWDVARAEEVAELRGHDAYVHAVAFSADGTRLVSCSGDHTLRVWEAPEAGPLHGLRRK